MKTYADEMYSVNKLMPGTLWLGSKWCIIFCGWLHGDTVDCQIAVWFGNTRNNMRNNARIIKMPYDRSKPEHIRARVVSDGVIVSR